ncbi:Transcriptional regulator, PadR family [Mycetocola reblochoni REB411]|uniref:Transcriptional regulator, PadR family n=1 Tax=Mycetocola reblochoni REB411 TaxID=1255698 RepID=A0A1R4JI03_9MICO|nr:Transcriptional regulator, PadR family [Mycetocola reblochoni REB411]
MPGAMSVRWALLVLLGQRACYGYQLKLELHRRLDGWDVNVGQVYNTLERLVRDGLIARAGESGAGQLLYRTTPRGEAELAQWWETACAPTAQGAAERLTKVALAVSLPGVDALAVLDGELAAVVAADSAAADGVDAAGPGTGGGPGASVAPSVLALARRAEHDARRSWLTGVRAGLVDGTLVADEWAVEQGRRGRPSASTGGDAAP